MQNETKPKRNENKVKRNRTYCSLGSETQTKNVTVVGLRPGKLFRPLEYSPTTPATVVRGPQFTEAKQAHNTYALYM